MYEAIKWNIWKSRLLLFFALIFVSVVAYVFSVVYRGSVFVPLAFIIALAMAIGSYYSCDKIVLMSMQARVADREEFPHFVNSVEGLAIAAGLPTPRAYVVDDPAPNAFATGRDPAHAIICVTTGLLDMMNRTELEGVIGHEMSHIKNYDIRFMTVVAVLVGFIALLGDWFRWGGRIRDNDRNSGALIIVGLIFAILAPIAAAMIQAAISRKREFLADANGALLTRYPDGLANALRKIAQDPHRLQSANKATAHMFIANPLKDYGGKVNSLFSTHPSVDERIMRLEAM